MKKVLFATILATLVLALTGGAVLAAEPDKTDATVSPVLGGNAGENGNSPVFTQTGQGFWTVEGPNVTVPIHATNMDGFGNPDSGPYAAPGDPGYSPLWTTGVGGGG